MIDLRGRIARRLGMKWPRQIPPQETAAIRLADECERGGVNGQINFQVQSSSGSCWNVTLRKHK